MFARTAFDFNVIPMADLLFQTQESNEHAASQSEEIWMSLPVGSPVSLLVNLNT